tara:strand:+ start:2430 stop:2675 length:246 start_codon:yes stop_codon:yes gene_type:complete
MIVRRVKVYANGELVEEYDSDVEWEFLRERRDQALADTDWRAVKDRTMSQAWKDYRQALRDLPEHLSANDAADNWPVMPDE